jgi:hypothetical protein
MGINPTGDPDSWRGLLSSSLRKEWNTMQGNPKHLIISHLVVSQDEKLLETVPKSNGTVSALVIKNSMLYYALYQPTAREVDINYQGVNNGRLRSSLYEDSSVYGPR